MADLGTYYYDVSATEGQTLSYTLPYDLSFYDSYTIFWSTRDGTATAADGDFVPMTGNSTSGSVQVLIDEDSDPNEVFYVDATFTGTYTDWDGSTVVDTGAAEATITIEDRLPPVISFSTGSMYVIEGQSATYWLSRSFIPAGDIGATAYVSVVGGSAVEGVNYQSLPDRITVNFGPGATMASFTITTMPNSLIQPTLNMELQIVDVENAAIGFSTASTYIQDAVGLTVDGWLQGTSANNVMSGTPDADKLDGLGGNDTIRGGEGNDWLKGGTGNDSMEGAGGRDRLEGGDGNDVLDGGDAQDTLVGGLGNDTFVLGNGTDGVSDSGGIDTITSTITRALGSYGTVENLTLLGTVAINGTGNGLANTIVGNNAANQLIGLGGNDVLAGSGGNDRFVGGSGADIMTGGAGNDIFDFNSLAEMGVGTARDRVRDFAPGSDKLDFRTIDTNAGAAGDQNFAFLATKGADFTGATGQLRWYWIDAAGTANDKTVVAGDMNADRVADFEVELLGLKSLSVTDFIL